MEPMVFKRQETALNMASDYLWRVAEVLIHKSGWPRSLAFGDLGCMYDGGA